MHQLGLASEVTIAPSPKTPGAVVCRAALVDLATGEPVTAPSSPRSEGLAPGGSSPAATSLESCQAFAIPPEHQPTWLTSAVWWQVGGRILAVDCMRRRVLAFHPDGRPAGPLFALGPEAEQARPTRLRATERGFLLSFMSLQLIEFGKRFELLRSFSLQGGPTASGLAAVNQWIPAGEQLFGQGHVEDRAAPLPGQLLPRPFYRSGFFLADLDGTVRSARIVLPFESSAPYLLDIETMVRLQDTIYFVEPTEKPQLRAVEPSTGAVTTVAGMPPGFESRSPLSVRSSGPVTLVQFLREVQAGSLVTGLYAIGSRLFVLTREPDSALGGTRWLLHALDPETGRYTKALRLPTTAPFLTLVPAGRWLFLFERGPVEEYGHQPVETLIRIPASWFEQPLSSPLRVPGASVLSCDR
ncbi:MAG TPA: hypothetical protein VF017_03190 [Thermoanaerobaculia bacterium]|nr:hypothetical protein [Thermoanaerobaculia bacterium]